MENIPISFRQVSHFVWSYYRKYPFWVMVVTISLMGQAALEVVLPYAVGKLIDYISVTKIAGVEALPEVFHWLAVIAAAGLGFHFLHIGTHFVYDWFLKFPLMRNVGVDAFYKVQRFSTDWHVNSFAGAIVTKIKRGKSAFEVYSDEFYINFLPLFFLIIGMTSFLIFKWKFLGLFFAGVAIIYAIISTLLVSKYVSPISRKAAIADTAYGAALADALTCNAVVKMFGNEAREDRRFFTVAQHWMLTLWRRYMTGNLISLVQNILMTALKISLFSLAVWMWYRGRASVGEVVFIIGTYNVLQAYLRDIGDRIRTLQQSVNDMEEVVEYSLMELQVPDLTDAKALRIERGEIRFQKVHFEYPQQHRKVYNELNVTIPGRQKVALVGRSGSGKSTFVKLIQRLYDVQSGEILIDGQNITQITQESLRKNISLVPQDPLLFHRTIAENIGYGSTQVNQEMIESAAKKAHAYEFIARLPNLYKTLVGERGVKLSGGERQRIAIARAIVANAPILILDEATSSLDTESEKYIQAAMHHLLAKKTAIIIAHRLSTIQEVDRILVFEDGKIIEDGSFAELIAKGEVFAKMWKLQKID